MFSRARVPGEHEFHGFSRQGAGKLCEADFSKGNAFFEIELKLKQGTFKEEGNV